MKETVQKIREAGIVVVLRGDFSPERLLEIADAVTAGGIRVLELTLNSRDPVAGIGRLRERVGDRATIGAGTVRTVAGVEMALDAGAEFIVSPNLDLPSIERAHAAGIPHLPGVFTPTEAHAAHAAGCALVKLFPIDAVGPGYLRALRAPLDDIGFIAVGGIDENNLGEYIRAGAVGVGVGGSLVKGPQESGEVIEARARRLVEALAKARAG